MSLIPSESLNFPDSFRANVGWHMSQDAPKPKSRTRPQAVPVSVADEPSKSSPEPPPKAGVVSPPPPRVAEPPATRASEEAKALEPPEPEPEPEPDSTSNTTNDAVAPAGATLTGTDAAAFLSKIFFSATAPTDLVEPVNGQSGLTSPPSSSRLPLEADCAAPLHALAAAAAESKKIASVPTAKPASEEISPVTASPTPTVEEQGPSAISVTPPDSAATPVEPPSLVVETPTQTQHFFELIAAAAQRGAISEGTSSSPSPEQIAPAAAEATTTPTPAQTEPERVVSQPIAAESTPAVARAPAKIRIQPRKIKPRPVSAPVVPSEPVNVVPEVDVSNGAAPSFRVERGPSPVSIVPKTESAPQKPEQPVRRVDYRELARSIPDARVELTYSERRNRWIGFALSELAALTSVVLLAGYGFTHKFPDPTLKILIFILMFTAAAVAFALPIAFIRNDPGRWKKRALNYRRE